MKQVKNIVLFALAAALVLFDVSFLSNFEVYGATILSSYSLLIIMSVLGGFNNFAYFSLSLVILFAVFSSLPIFLILLNFVGLPLLFNFVRHKYFHAPNRFTILIYLVIANFLFEAFVMIWLREFSPAGVLTVGYFTIINTVAGFLISLVYIYLRTKVGTGNRDKLQ